jgi:penicillin-binding protein 1A
VLDKMAELRMISRPRPRRQGRAARRREQPLLQPARESFFFDYVRQELVDKYGTDRVRKGGLRIYTTIDLKMQRKAREAINATLAFPKAPKSAIVTVHPGNGKILAMASSANYAETKFNLAAQGRRQPGSTFKIMGLMAALDRGVSPEGTSYTSKPLKFNAPGYGPIETKTYDNTYGGRMNLVRATTRSDNSVYMQLGLDLGPDSVKKAAREMGHPSKLEGYPGEILGGLGYCCSPLEMANAYATIASAGLRNRPIAITKVEFPDGRTSGSTSASASALRGRASREGHRHPQENMPVRHRHKASIGCPAAGKTARPTTTPTRGSSATRRTSSTSVWVGFPTSRIEMYPPTTPISVAGGTYPAEIWGAYMRQVKKGCPTSRPRRRSAPRPSSGRYASTGAPAPAYHARRPPADGAAPATGGPSAHGGNARTTAGTTPTSTRRRPQARRPRRRPRTSPPRQDRRRRPRSRAPRDGRRG